MLDLIPDLFVALIVGVGAWQVVSLRAEVKALDGRLAALEPAPVDGGAVP